MKQALEGGNIKVYTGPRGGKFIITKNGKKNYLDKPSYNKNIKYLKPKK